MKRLLVIVVGAAVFAMAPGTAERKVYSEADAPRSAPAAPAQAQALDDLLAGRFRWTVSAPLIGPANRPEDPCYGVKDPSVVFYQGRWHVFVTIRSQKRARQIEYLSFADWKNAERAPRHVLTLSKRDFGAPQVFYFSPHKKWYLIYQEIDNARRPNHYPVYSTTTDIADPTSWTKPVELFAQTPANVKEWIDFWVICDASRAHLFFTSLDGRMWRAETKLADFPGGWGQPAVALRGDVFEASHTYRLRGLDKYLTVIEALDGPDSATCRRYYQAYIADRLDGDWKPLANSKDKPFAGTVNTRFAAASWADSFSHGELLRAGHDEKLEVDPARLVFLFQGVNGQARQGKKYGEIPWRLGLLEPVAD
jgi:hypothetical protein